MKYNIVQGKIKEEFQNIPQWKDLAKVYLSQVDVRQEKIEELIQVVPEKLIASQADCVKACVKRIFQAKENHEKVMVCGDYDCDGICSTTMMVKVLKLVGIDVEFQIPDRFSDGYGLNLAMVEYARHHQISVLITVDNGVKAHAALALAKEYQIEVIVTDHHTIEEEIASSLVVHPSLMEPAYKYLCGAGVVLQIALGIFAQLKIMHREDMAYIQHLVDVYQDLTIYAMVALIGDIMLPYQQTRAIIQHGLFFLSQKRQHFIYRLCEQPVTKLNDVTISFQVVPKINSAGRLDEGISTMELVQLLTSEDPIGLTKAVADLVELNKRRKQISLQQVNKAITMVDQDPIEVLADPSFHEGICGLIAGRLTHEFHKPCIVLKQEGALIKGSGRSVPGIHLFDILTNYDRFIAFGGHEQAVGLSLSLQDLSHFKQYVSQQFEKMYPDGFQQEKLAIAVDPALLELSMVENFEALYPLPKDMLEPLFAIPYQAFKLIFQKEKIQKWQSYQYPSLEIVHFQQLKLPVDPKYFIGKISIHVFRQKKSCQFLVEDVI